MSNTRQKELKTIQKSIRITETANSILQKLKVQWDKSESQAIETALEIIKEKIDDSRR